MKNVWELLDPDNDNEVTRHDINNVLSDSTLAKVATAFNQAFAAAKVPAKVEL